MESENRIWPTLNNGEYSQTRAGKTCKTPQAKRHSNHTPMHHAANTLISLTYQRGKSQCNSHARASPALPISRVVIEVILYTVFCCTCDLVQRNQWGRVIDIMTDERYAKKRYGVGVGSTKRSSTLPFFEQSPRVTHRTPVASSPCGENLLLRFVASGDLRMPSGAGQILCTGRRARGDPSNYDVGVVFISETKKKSAVQATVGSGGPARDSFAQQA